MSTVALFGSSQTEIGSKEWEDAYLAGRRIAESGGAVITGGYGGTMEAVSKGAAEAGGHVIGVIVPAIFPTRSGANPYVAEVIETSTLASRLDALMGRADAAISLPGSIGTATELVLSWNTNHIRRRNGGRRLPCAAVGAEWKRIGMVLADTIGALADDIYWADTADEAVDWVLASLD